MSRATAAAATPVLPFRRVIYIDKIYTNNNIDPDLHKNSTHSYCINKLTYFFRNFECVHSQEKMVRWPGGGGGGCVLRAAAAPIAVSVYLKNIVMR